MISTVAGEAIAYPFEILAEEVVINDTVGELEVVAIRQSGATSALDRSNIDDSRDVGIAALYNRELDRQTLTFNVDENGVIRDDQTGSIWNIFGTAIGVNLWVANYVRNLRSRISGLLGSHFDLKQHFMELTIKSLWE